MRMRKLVVTGAGLALAVAVASATPGWSHSGGRVQLFVDRLNLHSVAGNDWTVSVTLVDADSGTPAPGFDVVAEADPAAGALTLSDQGAGQYSAPFTAAPGKKDIAIRAETQPGGTPGVPLRKVYSVMLEPGKDVAIGAGSGRSGFGLAVPAVSIAVTAAILGWFLVSRRRRSALVAVALAGIVLHGGARPAEATETPSDVRVGVERSDKVGQTPLWIPVRVTVTEGEGRRPLSVDHLVFAAARNNRGDEAGPFSLGPLEANDPNAKGIHQGFVIVPYGGSWTITALAKTAHADPGVQSTVLGRATADMVVDAPLAAAGSTGAATVPGKPDSEPLGAAVLWVHTMVAIAWAIVVALLALLALPAGRRFLSEGGNVLDGHLDKIARAAWWTTGLVVASGIYNMVNSVAYRVPLSPDQVSRLFRLPYAKPYYLSLAVKLAAYAVMIGATVPLIAAARRRAAVDADTVSLADDDPSPWVNPDKPGGQLAVRTKQAVSLEADSARPTEPDGRGRVPVAIMVAGGAVIITAVTLLKYLHLLGELSRLAG
jgi:hypothetical protein